MRNYTDEEQIREVVYGYCDAYNDKDLDKVMSFFSDDCGREVSYDAGHKAIGKAAVRATFVAELERIDAIEGSRDIPSLNISGDVADAIYNYRMEFTDLQENKVRVTATGKGAVKLRKISGEWKITDLKESIDTWDIHK